MRRLSQPAAAHRRRGGRPETGGAPGTTGGTSNATGGVVGSTGGSQTHVVDAGGFAAFGSGGTTGDVAVDSGPRDGALDSDDAGMLLPIPENATQKVSELRPIPFLLSQKQQVRLRADTDPELHLKMKNVLVLVAFISTGCGGSEFIAGFAGMSDDAGVEASNGGEPGAGGSPAVGGATSSTGGVVNTGGAYGYRRHHEHRRHHGYRRHIGHGRLRAGHALHGDRANVARLRAAQNLRRDPRHGCLPRVLRSERRLCVRRRRKPLRHRISVHTPYDGVGEMVWSENCIVYRATIGAGYGSCAYAADWK